MTATNNVAPYVPPAPPVAQGLVPTTLAEAMQLANMMASSKLVPVALRDSPADCLMVIQQAVRWQMDPFAVAQECSVIQGKLMYGGKLVAAVVNSRGGLEERLSFDYAGTGETRTITVSGKVRGEKAARTVAVILRDARTNAAVWKTQPDQQLMYHGSRVWARRHVPELMLGVWSPEEFPAEAANSNQPAPASEISPIAPVTVERPPEHDPVTGEVGPRELPLPAGDTPWRRMIAWGASYIAALNGAQTLVEIDQWQRANYAHLDEVKKAAPKIYERILPNIESARKKLILKETAAKPPAMQDLEAHDGPYDGIPSFLDRNKQAPTPEDSEMYLTYISDRLADCSTSAQAIAVWDKFLPTLADMFPRDASIAGDVLERTLEALRKQELEAVS
jgi:hypothetical protein